MVTKLRPVAADGIGLILHGFKSRLTRTAAGGVQTASDGSGLLLVRPKITLFLNPSSMFYLQFFIQNTY